MNLLMNSTAVVVHRSSTIANRSSIIDHKQSTTNLRLPIVFYVFLVVYPPFRGTRYVRATPVRLETSSELPPLLEQQAAQPSPLLDRVDASSTPKLASPRLRDAPLAVCRACGGHFAHTRKAHTLLSARA